MNLGSAIQALAIDLNDYPSLVWTEDQLRRWLLEGILEYSVADPAAFSTTMIIKVDCVNTTDLDCCGQILEVVGQSTKTGQVLHKLYEIADDAHWPGGTSTCNRRTKLEEYTIGNDGKSINFYPKPLPGTELYVVIKCLPELATFDDSGSIPEKAIPAVMQWALFRAMSMDAENNPAAFTLAQQHREAFNQLIIRKEAAEDKKELKRKNLWPSGASRRRSQQRS